MAQGLCILSVCIHKKNQQEAAHEIMAIANTDYPRKLSVETGLISIENKSAFAERITYFRQMTGRKFL